MLFRSLIVLLALTTEIDNSKLQIQEPPPPALVRAIRASRDLARFDPARIISEPEKSYPWLLIEVKETGREEDPNLYLDEDGKQEHIGLRKPKRRLGEASLRVIDSFTVAPEYEPVAYSRDLPPTPSDPEDHTPYSPLKDHDHALVLCRYNETGSDFYRFRPAIYVPDDWKEFVRPAVAWVTEMHDAAAHAPAEQIERSWADASRSQNPMLVAAAFRRMMGLGRIDLEWMTHEFPKADRRVQAAVVCTVAWAKRDAARAAYLDVFNNLMSAPPGNDIADAIMIGLIASQNRGSHADAPRLDDDRLRDNALRVLGKRNPDDKANRYLMGYMKRIK